MSSAANQPPLPAELLEILRCPKCKGLLDLVAQVDPPTLNCNACRLRYPIREGIPIMLVDQALPQ